MPSGTKFAVLADESAPSADTAGGGKLCSLCGETKPQAAFSNKQWGGKVRAQNARTLISPFSSASLTCGKHRLTRASVWRAWRTRLPAAAEAMCVHLQTCHLHSTTRFPPKPRAAKLRALPAAASQ
jgi:hypothetical protein